ncbi:MAG TPA: mechanosensitive ion channel family protein [Xanthomonadales bacterium]|nr:mechanosensitive ion channel family protein [Xanthomonadales bacterium]
MNRSPYPRVPCWCVSAIMALLLAAPALLRAQANPADAATDQAVVNTAPVNVDGRQLFLVRGVTSFPAAERAAVIRRKIIAAARNREIAPEHITITELPDRSNILAGETQLMGVFDVDGDIEGLDKKLAASVYRQIIIRAIEQYRTERSPPVLLRNSGYALVATLLMALLLWGTVRLFRWLDGWTIRHVQSNIETLGHKSHELIQAAAVWKAFAGLLRALRILIILLLIYFYLNTVLGLYPWTRPVALVLFDLVLNPLESLGRGFLASIPSLAFLVILFLLVRYIIKATRLFFDGVASGRIKLRTFDPDWAVPTYRITRLLIIAFSLVVAYPYIPGSDSGAFKGVSLFLGVIFSLGSSSFIANMLAGQAMTYRGAFKKGDRVKIDDVVGLVEDIKLMVTRIRTPKNEIVVVPNSNILNTNVTNFSTLAREQGLILHTVVGISYEVPWRQVEAMLLLAAERTEGLKKEPKPFVLQLSLGDFAVNYELNVYCADETRMLALYSALHRNILDVFNEHGVQIMTPAYEGDPEIPKVVPPAEWYATPAGKPGA